MYIFNFHCFYHVKNQNRPSAPQKGNIITLYH